MAWLWTDILAALLVEEDRVAPARVVEWVERPVAYRLADDAEPLELARSLLETRPGPAAARRAFDPT